MRDWKDSDNKPRIFRSFTVLQSGAQEKMHVGFDKVVEILLPYFGQRETLKIVSAL